MLHCAELRQTNQRQRINAQIKEYFIVSRMKWSFESCYVGALCAFYQKEYSNLPVKFAPV